MPASHPLPEAEPEVVDAVPVQEGGALPSAPSRVSRELSAPVVRQAAAVAATSFVAGAATIVAARIVRRGGLRRRPRNRALARGQVVATRSFLVDVHVLAPRD